MQVSLQKAKGSPSLFDAAFEAERRAQNSREPGLRLVFQDRAQAIRPSAAQGGEVEYSVTDTGPGVPDEDRDRVVQRFVRLDNSRTEAGSGLGLSLVQAVAEAHGGRLQLDEGPGAVDGFGPGLRVALLLPPA